MEASTLPWKPWKRPLEAGEATMEAVEAFMEAMETSVEHVLFLRLLFAGKKVLLLRGGEILLFARCTNPWPTHICLTNMTCERSRAIGTICPTPKTLHLQLSALPLATRPLATARPCYARPTNQPSVSLATQRPTSLNSASGEHEKLLPGTARALSRKVENRKKVQIPPMNFAR